MIFSFSNPSKNTSVRITRRLKTRAAFTLIELLVVIAIFGIIMSVALSNQQSLNGNLLISNLAYEIGLVVRETQAYGIGVRAQPGVANAQNFQGAFGLNVTLDPVTHKADKIIVFKDLPAADGSPPNGRYDGPTELFSVYQFQNQKGNKVVALCVSDQYYFCERNLAGSVDELNVVFRRPNPEAAFYVLPQPDIMSPDGDDFTARGGTAMIVVNMPDFKNCRAVIIEPTGQIRVESGKSSYQACPDTGT
jgi:prepilin-type N-terminal cleavage/methylation domain-containing protein